MLHIVDPLPYKVATNNEGDIRKHNLHLKFGKDFTSILRKR